MWGVFIGGISISWPSISWTRRPARSPLSISWWYWSSVQSIGVGTRGGVSVVIDRRFQFTCKLTFLHLLRVVRRVWARGVAGAGMRGNAAFLSFGVRRVDRTGL